MNLSLKTNTIRVVDWSARMFRLIGLLLVMWMVFLVCDDKLAALKENNNQWQTGYVSAQDKLKQLDCLTKNIYWEAASEPFEGKVGVAQVTMNRLESGRFADTVCGVVYQKNVVYQKVICQFSWYCENNHVVRPVHKELWKESELVAKKVLLENFRLPSLGKALYYHADYVSPNWRKPKIEQIGRHIFYGDRT